MVDNLFADFLVDSEQYRLSEQFWVELWCRLDLIHRRRYEWTWPWLGTGSPNIKDGNPIFSAYSPVLRRGVRVIQEEPIGADLDFRAWLDTFGGDITDPDRIDELVVSCTLSESAARYALDLMASWVKGKALLLKNDGAGHLLPTDPGSLAWKIRKLEYAA